MTPATYGKGGRGALINYAIVETPLGHLLVAATSRGVCSVMLGESETSLKANLLKEFPAAEIRHDEKALSASVKTIVAHLKSKTPLIDLPLDIQATAFQRQVWEQLRAIPSGETRSYGEVAKAIGQQQGGAGSGQGLCHQSGRARDSVSSRHS